jgi:hypothetical protein
MTPQPITTLPLGYDDRTTMGLSGGNEVVIIHPVMPPMMYDETVMRWVHVEHAKSKEPK